MAAIGEVRDGMRLGLGTGSTVAHLLDALGEKVRAGLRITGVPSSERTAAHALRLGIPLSTLDQTPELDLTIDGADEVDPRLDCLKGLGGACARERVLAAAAKRFVLIVDEGKLVARLGARAHVVVEVIPFAAPFVLRALGSLSPSLRMDGGNPYRTDNGNWLVELATGPLDDPKGLALRLATLPGVLDHGLFLGMSQAAYVAAPGGVRLLER